MNQPSVEGDQTRRWPGWARGLVSAALGFHLVAIFASAMAAPPASAFQGWLARRFSVYNQILDQGYSYRFYVNGPPPTPILLARLDYRDGSQEELRIPDRSMRPRLRFQRHLALAYHLRRDFEGAPLDPQGNSRSRWAESYARHLCKTNPDCVRVTLLLTDHLNPTPRELEDAAREGRLPIDVEAPRYYTVPERVGEYVCED